MAEKKVNERNFNDVLASIHDMLGQQGAEELNQPAENRPQASEGQGHERLSPHLLHAESMQQHRSISPDVLDIPNASNELIDVMMQDLIHSDTEKAFAYIETFTNIISDDVSQKLQQHIKVLLPQLIKASLQQHLQSQTNILNNKDNI